MECASDVVDSEISACDSGYLLESTNRYVDARFGATRVVLNSICRSFDAILSTRGLRGCCLKHWIDGAMVTVDLHAVLTSESIRHSETAGGSFRENHGQGPNSTLCQRNSETIDMSPG